MMATIKDVATKSNVSISTVSYVLNGKRKISQDTRNRVLNAVKELDYQPNLAASGLRTKRSRTIGILLPDISNAFFADLVYGIETKANRYGYYTIICNTGNENFNEKRYLEALIARNIDGLIYITVGNTIRPMNSKTNNIPVVAVDRMIGGQCSFVSLNNEKGGYLATNHLIEKGRKKIAIFSGPLKINTCLDRLVGYKNALRDNGIPYNENYLVETSLSQTGGYQAAKELLERKVAFDSVFAANDLMAMGCIRALYEQGMVVPDDVSVVGYDDIMSAEIFIPALTTIRQPRFEMGERVVDILIEQIKNPAKPIESIVFDPVLIERETVERKIVRGARSDKKSPNKRGSKMPG